MKQMLCIKEYKFLNEDGNIINVYSANITPFKTYQITDNIYIDDDGVKILLVETLNGLFKQIYSGSLINLIPSYSSILTNISK